MNKAKLFIADAVPLLEWPCDDEIYKQAEELGLDIDIVHTTANDPETLIREGKDADCVIDFFTPITKEFIDSLENCKLIIRTAVGVDTIDVGAASAAGIPVANVPDYCIEEVAMHTVALYLAVVRNLVPRTMALKSGAWRPPEVAYDVYLPRLSNKTFGLLGFGNIARRVATMIKPFVKEIWAYDPYLPDAVFEEMGVKKINDMMEILENADAVSLNLPLTDETRHMINGDVFSKMKSTAIILNTSRGPIIDQEALCDALENEVIAGAGIDVYEIEPLPEDSRIRSCPHIVMTAHQASASEESLPNLMQFAIDEIFRMLRDEPIKHCVNKRDICK